MARQSLSRVRRFFPIVLVAAAGCGPSAETAPPAAPEAVNPPTLNDASWGRFHSNRFQLAMALPEGKTWRIDDHRNAALVATHPPTQSRLALRSSFSSEWMNDTKCEETAREWGEVPPTLNANTIDDQLVAQPAGFDARSWVAVEAPLGAHKGWTGHAFLFAAQMHRCIVVHFTTEIARESERDALMARLLLVQTKLFPRLTVDAARTAADAPIPRANEKR